MSKCQNWDVVDENTTLHALTPNTSDTMSIGFHTHTMHFSSRHQLGGPLILHCVPGNSVRSHSLRTQTHKTAPTSDSRTRVCLVFLLTWYKSGFPQSSQVLYLLGCHTELRETLYFCLSVYCKKHMWTGAEGKVQKGLQHKSFSLHRARVHEGTFANLLGLIVWEHSYHAGNSRVLGALCQETGAKIKCISS
jgi:hypothetical protein